MRCPIFRTTHVPGEMNCMNVYKKCLFVLILVLLAILPNSRMADAQTAEYPARYGGKLVVALNGDPSTLNPAYTTSYNNHLVAGQIFNALVEYDPWTVEPVPELAESWEISKDGLTYTFHLVKNAFWHDGKPFTSADVKFSFEQAIIPFHPRGRASFGFIKFETPDSYTVVMKLAYPFAPLINTLGIWYAGIIPKHIYEGTDIIKNPRNFDNPVGTGPFMFKEWVKGSYIRFVRNPNYWRKGAQGEKLPYLDEVIFRFLPDNAMGMLAFDKGEIDYMPMYVPLPEIARYMNTPGVKVIDKGAFGSMWTYFFNLENQYLAQKKVRQAIAYAIDKEFIFKTVSNSRGKIATGPVSSVTGWAYTSDVNLYPHNVTLANQLLDEAGFKRGSDGTRFRLRLNVGATGRDNGVPASEIIKDQLRAVGIDIRLEVPEESVEDQIIYMNHDFDIALTAGLSTAPDPNMLRGYLDGASILPEGKRRPGLWNIMMYNNTRVNQIFAQAAVESDPAKRAALYKEMQKLVVEDLPCMWIVEDVYYHVFKDTFPDAKEWKGGIPVGPYGGIRERADRIFWKKGTAFASPATALSAINAAKTTLEGLRGQFYDVDAGMKKLADAQKAYDSGDYTTALSLAEQAGKLATPPYGLYTGVFLAVVVVVAAVVYMRKKRKA